jgi:hypothetical protein
MKVLLDTANFLIDPNTNTIEMHPKLNTVLQQSSRYEKVRKLNVTQFGELYKRNMVFGALHFSGNI